MSRKHCGVNDRAVQEVERGEVKAESFLGLVLVNHLLQQLAQIILVLQHGLPQNG